MHSAVLIIPAAHLAAINALGAVRGWGNDNYTVPLGPEGAEAPTHFGARVDVSPAFITELVGVAQGQLPSADWSSLGTTEADVLAAVAALIADFDPDSVTGETVYGDPRVHFDAVVANLELIILSS